MICEYCGKEHNGNYGSGRFCSKECARAYSSKNTHGQLKEAKCIDCGNIIYIGKRASIKMCRCKECKEKYNLIKYSNRFKLINKKIVKKTKSNCNIFNNINCEECYFKINNVCKSKSSIKYKLHTLSKYCGLVISDYNNTLNNYLEIKYSLQQMINSGLSGVDICNKLCGSSKKGNTLFNILNLKGRNLSEAVSNAFIQGKMNAKEGFHITWNNKEVYLRSSYELDYAKELDKQQIDYTVESLQIKYWDSQLLKFRQAIPDFYIPSTNTIIEIKSSWTYDKQNMFDKMNAYLKLGYKFKLIYEHKEYTSVV